MNILKLLFGPVLTSPNRGDLENGKELTGIALKNHSGWKELLIRCSENNFFGITEELVQQLLNTEQ